MILGSLKSTEIMFIYHFEIKMIHKQVPQLMNNLALVFSHHHTFKYFYIFMNIEASK